jgi:hypothetical protein
MRVGCCCCGPHPGSGSTNGTRADSNQGFYESLSESAFRTHVGKENRAPGRFRDDAQKIANLKLAERVGFPSRDVAKPNQINSFAIISRNRNDLASSNLRQRFRPFAGICRFSYFDGTRNGTRREAPPDVCAGQLPPTLDLHRALIIPPSVPWHRYTPRRVRDRWLHRVGRDGGGVSRPRQQAWPARRPQDSAS